ncbi:hypothetical protein TNCV_4498091 [Trichonephila clavipes]|nr:hypothetical protein TNCV_4498091 [Trichonephila clavipes]
MFRHNQEGRGCSYHGNRVHTDYVIKVIAIHTSSPHLPQKETDDSGNPCKRPQVGNPGERRKKKRTRKRRKKSSEKTRAGRFRKRRGESQSFLFGDADQESETRMRKNALRTGRRQAVE